MVRYDRSRSGLQSGRPGAERTPASAAQGHPAGHLRLGAPRRMASPQQHRDRVLEAAAPVGECGQPRVCLTINPQLGLFSEDLW